MINFNNLKFEAVIDVRDIIERVEELEDELEPLIDAVSEAAEARAGLDESADTLEIMDGVTRTRESLETAHHAAMQEESQWRTDNGEELRGLLSILEDLKGYGGDEQWRGDWYPVTLISESYFTDYTEELVSDCYDLKLPNFVHVDWEATAKDVKVDYSTVEIDDVTFFYR